MPDEIITIGVQSEGVNEAFRKIYDQLTRIPGVAARAMSQVNKAVQEALKPPPPAQPETPSPSASQVLGEVTQAARQSAQELIQVNREVADSAIATSQEVAQAAQMQDLATATEPISELKQSLNQLYEEIRRTMGPTGDLAEGMGKAAQAARPASEQFRASGQSLNFVQRVAASAREALASLFQNIGYGVRQVTSLAFWKERLGRALNFLLSPLRAVGRGLTQLTKSALGLDESVRRSQRSTDSFSRSTTYTVRRSYAAARAMDYFSSAMQGIALGVAVADRSLIGVMMNLYFMRFAILKVYVPMAALSLTFSTLAKAASLLKEKIFDLGSQAQDIILHFGALANSQAQGAAMWAISAHWAVRYGRTLDETRKSMVALWQQGLLNEDMFRATLTLAAAWNKSLEEAAQIISEAVGKEEGHLESLVQYGVIVDSVTNSTERSARATAVASAIMSRFGDIAEERVQTLSGAMTRLRSAINFLWEVLAEPLAAALAPLINSIGNFVATLASFIGAMWRSASVQAYWNETLHRARALTERFAPEIQMLGAIVGQIVAAGFWILMRAIRGCVSLAERFLMAVRQLVGSFSALLRPLKPTADSFRILGQAWKELSFTELLKKAKELAFNLPITLGGMTFTIQDVLNSVKNVLQERSGELVGVFFGTLAANWLSQSLGLGTLANPLTTVLLDVIGRVFIDLATGANEEQKASWNRIFDVAMVSAVVMPLILKISGWLLSTFGGELGAAIGGAILGLPGWALTAIGLAVGLIVGYLDEKFDIGIRDWLNRLSGWAGETWRGFWENLLVRDSEGAIQGLDFDRAFNYLRERLETAWNELKPDFDFSKLVAWIQDAISGAGQSIQDFISAFISGSLAGGVESADAGGIGASISWLLGEALKLAPAPVQELVEYIGNFIGRIPELVHRLSLGVDLPGIFPSLFEPLIGVAASLPDLIDGPLRALRDIFTDNIAPLLSDLGGLVASAGKFFGMIGDAIAKAFAPGTPGQILLEKGIGAIRDGLIGLVKFLGGVIELATLPFRGLLNTLSMALRAVVGLLDVFLKLLTEGPEAAKERLLQLFSDLWGQFEQFGDRVKETIRSAVRKITEALSIGSRGSTEFWSMVFGADLESIRQSVMGWFSNAGESISNGFNSLREKASEFVDNFSSKWDAAFGQDGLLVTTARTAVADGLGLIAERLVSLRDSARETVSKISDAWDNVFGSEGSIAAAAGSFGPGVVAVIGSAITSFRDSVWNPVANAISNKWNEILGSNGLVGQVARAFDSVVLQPIRNFLTAFRTGNWEPIINGLHSFWDSIFGQGGLIPLVAARFHELVLQPIINFLSTFKNETLPGVVNAISNLWDSVFGEDGLLRRAAVRFKAVVLDPLINFLAGFKDRDWPALINPIRDLWESVFGTSDARPGALIQAIRWFRDRFNDIKNAVVGAIDSLTSKLRDLWNWIQDVLRGLGLIRNSSATGGNVPGMQTGGIVRSPTIVRVGERPEAVVPLVHGAVPVVLQGRLPSTVNITVNVGGGSASQADEVAEAILLGLRRAGVLSTGRF